MMVNDYELYRVNVKTWLLKYEERWLTLLDETIASIENGFSGGNHG